jgi:hypothetical protein
MKFVEQLMRLVGRLQFRELSLKFSDTPAQSGNFFNEVAICGGGDVSQQRPGHMATFHGLFQRLCGGGRWDAPRGAGKPAGWGDVMWVGSWSHRDRSDTNSVVSYGSVLYARITSA